MPRLLTSSAPGNGAGKTGASKGPVLKARSFGVGHRPAWCAHLTAAAAWATLLATAMGLALGLAAPRAAQAQGSTGPLTPPRSTATELPRTPPVKTLQYVVYGQVVAVEGAHIVFRTPDGQQGSMELSPLSFYHDASGCPPSLTQASALRVGDIIVITTDNEQHTHLLIAHGARVHPDWDSIFVSLVPGYRSMYATTRPARGGTPPGEHPRSEPPAGATEAHAQQPPLGTHDMIYAVQVYGRLMSKHETELHLLCLAGSQQGRMLRVNLPSDATLVDTALPLAPSPGPAMGGTASLTRRPSALKDLEVGDEVMLSSDTQQVPHVLFLHLGQRLHPSWNGHLSAAIDR
jgi:hypothetical protein